MDEVPRQENDKENRHLHNRGNQWLDMVLQRRVFCIFLGHLKHTLHHQYVHQLISCMLSMGKTQSLVFLKWLGFAFLPTVLYHALSG